MATRDLLPDYLKEPSWLDLADAIDFVFGGSVEPAMKCLEFLRFMYIPSIESEAKAEDRQMLSFTDFDLPEKAVAVKQTNLLGLKVTRSSGLNQSDFVTLSRNLGGFWYSKGTFDFIDFVGYCLNTDVTLDTLWTNNYVDFYSETDPAVGTKIWDGGSWYPTTHVAISWDSGKFSVPLNNIVSLFNDVSNYNLVLHDIFTYIYLWVDHQGAPVVQYPVSSPCDIVAMGLTYKTVVNIQNY